MLNNEEFTKRLSNFIAELGISAGQFADKIGVPRSSISHLISGRNKPSLDFVLKVVDSYPNLTLNWLLYGNDENHKPTQTQHSLVNSITASKKEIEKIVIFYKDGTFNDYLPND